MSTVFVLLDMDTIRTTVATNKEEVDEGIKALMSNYGKYKRSIGLDIIAKRTPSTKSSAAELLQLDDGIQCLIIRLHRFENLPEFLYNFLSLPAFTFAGFGIKDTMSTLKKDYGLVCKITLEVGPSGWYHSRITSMSCILTSMHIPAFCCISDVWDAENNLRGEMINFAVSNAIVAFRLGENILKVYH